MLYGRIVFETKNMITIKTKSGVKKIAKAVSTRIKLYNPSGACFISGGSFDRKTRGSRVTHIELMLYG